jgi:hypothetical protein
VTVAGVVTVAMVGGRVIPAQEVGRRRWVAARVIPASHGHRAMVTNPRHTPSDDLLITALTTLAATTPGGASIEGRRPGRPVVKVKRIHDRNLWTFTGVNNHPIGR